MPQPRRPPAATALLLLALCPQPSHAPADVGSSITSSRFYSQAHTICHGGSGSLTLSAAANSGTAVLVVSTYYTGCSPGRLDAPEYASIAASVEAAHPGQVRFLTSLKGSSSCSAWGGTYFGAGSKVDTLADTSMALHYGLFSGNPQYAIIDRSGVLRERFGSSGLSQQAVLASVGMYLSSSASEAAQEAYSSARTEEIAELAAKASHSGRVVAPVVEVQWLAAVILWASWTDFL